MDALKSKLPPSMHYKDPHLISHELGLELIRTTNVDFDRLVFLSNYLTATNWRDICEERSISNVCGWPMCNENIESANNKPKQIIDISKGIVRMVDRTELLMYCTKGHLEKSKRVAASLTDEPWWLKTSRSTFPNFDWLKSALISEGVLSADSVPEKQPFDLSDLEIQEVFSDVFEYAPSQSMDIDAALTHEVTTSLASTDIQPPPSSTRSIQNIKNGTNSMAESNLSNQMKVDGKEKAKGPPKKVTFNFAPTLEDDASQGSETYTIERLEEYEDDEIFMDTSEEEEMDTTSNDACSANFPFFMIPTKKHSLETMSEEPRPLQLMNMVLNWVTWKSQKFCNLLNYSPLDNTATLSISTSTNSDNVHFTNSTNQSDEDLKEKGRNDFQMNQDNSFSRRLPAVDSMNPASLRRSSCLQFISLRWKAFANYYSINEPQEIGSSLNILVSTFDFTNQFEGLKTAEWNLVLVSLLLALSIKRHPGLEMLLANNRTSLMSQFKVDYNAAYELVGLFKT